MKSPLFADSFPTNTINKPDWWNANEVHLCTFCTFKNAQQNDRKWNFPLFSVLRHINQMFSFWFFWNYCFQFVSYACFANKTTLCFNYLRKISRISRRKSRWLTTYVSFLSQQHEGCICSSVSIISLKQ